MLPSLLSFEFFQPAIFEAGGISKRGGYGWIFPGRVDAFLDATLDPLLAAARPVREGVYAFEVINEPQWAVYPGPWQFDIENYGRVPTMHLVSGAEMSQLIEKGVSRIVHAGYLSSVGFHQPQARWLTQTCLQKLKDLAAEGKYIHQVHHYPTFLSRDTIPDHDTLPIKPCLLGEFPTAQGGGDLSNVPFYDRALRQTEKDPAAYLKARLTYIKQQGYHGAFPWAARSNDPRSAFGQSQRQQLSEFSQGL